MVAAFKERQHLVSSLSGDDERDGDFGRGGDQGDFDDSDFEHEDEIERDEDNEDGFISMPGRGPPASNRK